MTEEEPRYLVPYYRTSTDDKGQDPMRQDGPCRDWAAREGFLLLKPEIDEGTSASKVLALDRARFVAACERAKAAGAEGVLIEAPDRFSRQDPFRAIWEMVEVKDRFGLEVYFARHSLAMQSDFAGRLVVFIELAMSHRWVEEHAQKARASIERRRSIGKRVGRKPKEFSPDEWDLIEKMRGEGSGWPTVALEVNRRRGVHELTDRAKAKRLSVSKASVYRAWERRKAEKAEQNGV